MYIIGFPLLGGGTEQPLAGLVCRTLATVVDLNGSTKAKKNLTAILGSGVSANRSDLTILIRSIFDLI